MLFPFMRLRINELLHERKISPGRLAQLSKGRISEPTAYRLARDRGKVDAVSIRVLEAMLDVFECAPNDLFER